MTNRLALQTEGAKRLAEAGIGSARADARVLMDYTLDLTPEQRLAHCRLQLMGVSHRKDFKPEPEPVHDAEAVYRRLIERRAKYEPVAYITGLREFWSLEFRVGPGVLVPRPETETLIEEVLKEFSDKAAALNVLDIGTGSGCLLVAFLSEYPNARGLGIDVSEFAMKRARENADKHRLHARLMVRQGNWTDGIEETFDVIFSNPPYIEHDVIPTLDPDVAQFEPASALDGGPDGYAAYRELGPRIASHLKQSGRAFVELGKGQDETVCALFAAAGLETMRVAPDLSGVKRCLVARRSS